MLNKNNVLTLRTHLAINLIRGFKPAKGHGSICGLFKFSSLSSVIWESAQLDNPYADYYLAVITQRLEHCELEFEALENVLSEVRKQLEQLPSFTCELNSPVNETVHLHFANPYSYCAADLLWRYDNIALGLASATQNGFYRRKDFDRLIKLATHRMRSVFHAPQTFKKEIVITRRDCQQKNAVYQTHREIIDGIPEEILNRSVKTRFQPVAARISTTIDKSVNVH
jgi:integrating conjugative element protein (TIGR03761 family)